MKKGLHSTVCSVAIFLSLFVSISSQAVDSCFFSGGFYDGSCLEGGSTSSKNSIIGGSYPAFADAFNLNPASIPTIKTPIGVEAMYSKSPDQLRSPWSFAYIKGYQGVGTGVSTNADESFFSHNLIQAFHKTSYQNYVQNYVTQKSSGPSVNFGSALAIPFGELEKVIGPTLGGSLKWNRATQQWDIVWGTALSSKVFNIGVSYVKEKDVTGSGGSSTTTATAGLKFPFLRLDYSYIYFNSIFYKEPMRILSGSLTFNGIILTMANRTYRNYIGYQMNETMLSGQFKAGKTLALGLLMNYIPDTVTGTAQIFF